MSVRVAWRTFFPTTRPCRLAYSLGVGISEHLDGTRGTAFEVCLARTRVESTYNYVPDTKADILLRFVRSWMVFAANSSEIRTVLFIRGHFDAVSSVHRHSFIRSAYFVNVFFRLYTFEIT
jgi:hypothetical protein